MEIRPAGGVVAADRRSVSYTRFSSCEKIGSR
jgi:hypothetical protein